MTFNLTDEELRITITGLMELPAKQSLPLIQKFESLLKALQEEAQGQLVQGHPDEEPVPLV